MKIAIHDTPGSFSDRWKVYCKQNDISYELVNCYASDIIDQIRDCDALMWHFYHASPKATLFAKELLYSVQSSGKKVFPNFNTIWHFDDKVGQKYLLEALELPLVSTYIFYDKHEAIKWVKQTTFPKVFKLRGGAGSVNVKLVPNRRNALRLIKKAFRSGFKHDSQLPLTEIWRRIKLKKSSYLDLIKGVARIFFPTPYAKVHGKEKGYIYFQEFIPDNDHDIRVIVIGDKAFAIKRIVRKNDFRASGSGAVLYEKEHFRDETIRLSFEMAKKLKSQCVAFDFVYQNEVPFVVEISYGFIKEVYDPCLGYWDKDLKWYEGKFNPYGWIIDDLLNIGYIE